MQRPLQNLLLAQVPAAGFAALAGGSSASLNACTLWAAAGGDASGGTIISKNRDWKPDHTQVLKVHRDRKGYAYFGLYAEGNKDPGLKEGVNEHGLTVITATAGAIPKQPGTPSQERATCWARCWRVMPVATKCSRTRRSSSPTDGPRS